MELIEERRRILLNTPHIETISTSAFKTDIIAPFKKIEAKFDAIQDLHGYDNPWPAGGGKNLLNANANTGSSNNVNYIKNGDGTYTANGTANGTSSFIVGSIELTANTQYVISGCPSNGSGSSYNVRIRDDNYTALGFDVGNGATITPTETKTYYYQVTVVSGYSVSNLVFKPMVCLSTVSNPDYAHYAPYSNICPISGWTGMNVTRTGKNLLSDNFSDYTVGRTYIYLNDILRNGVEARFTFFDKDTSVDISGMNIGFCNHYEGSGALSLYRWAISDGVIQSNTTNIPAGYSQPLLNSIVIYPKTKATFDALFARYYIMVELGSTSTAYEPYQGTTYPISWQSEAGTVYGGSLDVTTGLLTATMASVDLGTLTWNRTTAYVAPVLYAIVAGKLKSNISILCSVYKFSGNFGGAGGFARDSENASIGTCYANEQIFVRDDSYTDTAAFKSAMSGVQLVYELATPQTYQLTPQQILTLKNNNTLMLEGSINELKYWTHI